MARSVQEERENKKWSTPKDPLATAIVYNSYKNPEQCGPPLPLNRVVRYLHSSSSSSDGNRERKDHNRLPLGQVPIAYVEDGLVSEKKHPTVTFKFGKIVYQLSVPDQGQEPSSPSVFLTPLWMKWMPILGGYSSSSCLAQKRIAQALEMHDQSMKILYKGKVLYPSSSCSEQQTSRQLIDLSNEQNKTKQPKIALLVMGTLRGHELHDAPPWWMHLLGTGRTILVGCLCLLQQALLKVYSVVRPLLSGGDRSSENTAL